MLTTVPGLVHAPTVKRRRIWRSQIRLLMCALACACTKASTPGSERPGRGPESPSDVGVLVPERGGWVVLPRFEYNFEFGGFRGTEGLDIVSAAPTIAAATKLRIHGLQLKPQTLFWGRSPIVAKAGARWDMKPDERPVAMNTTEGGDYEVATDKLGSGLVLLLEKDGKYPSRGWLFGIATAAR